MHLHCFFRVMAIALACLSAAAAEEGGEALGLEPMTVSVSRTPLPAERAGSSVTVISREDLERRQTAFLTDVLRDVPGIAVSRVGTLGSQTQLRMRGAEANHVLVLIDGVEANDPTAGDEFQFEHLLTSQIERVEIVRGPQSALWGSDALAGVINVITRRSTAPLAAGGLLEGGSFGTLRAAGNLGGARGAGQIDIGFAHLQSDGTNISRQGDEDDGYRNTSVNLTGRRRFTDALSVDIFARRTESMKQFDGTDFITTGLPVDADNETESTQTYLRAGADLHSFGARWRQSLSVAALETDNDNLRSGATSGSTGGQRLGFYYQSTVELVDASQWLTFAADHETEDFEQRGTATAFGDPNQDQRTRNTGYVVEYRARPVDVLDLSAAVRHDDNSDFADATTYRLTLSYRLASETRLTGAYGTGQKSPTFIERYGFFADAFLGNPRLEPESSRGWELGAHQRWAAGRLHASLVYFDETLEDEIDGFVFDAGSGLFTAENLSGESERRGVELTLGARLLDTLGLTAVYTYTDATQPVGSADADELRRPRHIAALGFDYAPAERLQIGLDVSYTGSQRDQFFPPFPQPAQFVELDDFVLVDLALAYRFSGGIEWTARVENLLDEQYEEVLGFRAPGIGAYTGLRLRLQ